MNLLLFLLIGLIAGVLAKVIMPGSSEKPYGWVLTMVLGVVGAYVGGFLFGLLGVAFYGLVGQVIASTIGACICIAFLRLLNRA